MVFLTDHSYGIVLCTMGGTIPRWASLGCMRKPVEGSERCLSIKGTGRHRRDVKLGSLNLCCLSSSSVTPVPGDVIAPIWSLQALSTYPVHIHTCRETLVCMKKNNNNKANKLSREQSSAQCPPWLLLYFLPSIPALTSLCDGVWPRSMSWN